MTVLVTEVDAPRRRSRAFAVAVCAVVALHVALLATFAPPRVMLSPEPVVTIDYALHWYQVDRASAAFENGGRLWGWDPLQLAGQPAGIADDLTSKGTELFVIALSRLKVAPALAFNLFILLVHLLLPLAGWASARLFGLSRVEALVVHALWLCLWFFDSFVHWAWWVGMITWGFASYGSVLYVALLYRALSDKAAKWWLLLALCGAALTLVHPFVVLALSVPCLLMVAKSWRTLSLRDHGWLWAAVVAAGATALVWIGPTLRFRHYLTDVDTFFNARLEFLFFDFWDLIRDGKQTGGPVRTVFRMLCFVAGGVTLHRWWRAGDRRAVALGSLVLWCVAFAYLAAYSWWGRQTQPYRQIAPAMLAAALPAAVLLCEVFAPSRLRTYPRAAQLALLLLAVVALPRVVRTSLHYLPEALPQQVLRSKLDVLTTPLVGLNEPKPLTMAHHSALPGHLAVRDWLAVHHRGRGRVVVSEWVMGEYLAAEARGVPILGGIRERNVPHVDAHLFRLDPEGDLPPAELSAYFRRYAAGFVIMGGEHGPVDARRDLLEPLEVVGGYRIYRVREEPSYFAVGQGRVLSQAVDRIEVEATTPDVVLRFHYMETLVCEPGCRVEREPVAGDRVGFIRVRGAPPKFAIVNRG